MPVPRLRMTLAIAVVAAAAIAAPARAAFSHRVLPGETLWSIAAANNFTTRTIAAFNGLSVDSPVYAGNTIQIPTVAEGAAALASAGVSSGSSSTSAGSEASHTVTPGESLSSIAGANGLSPATLAADNGLSPDALLLIGQTINVPTSSGTTTTSVGAPPPQEQPYWTSPIYCPSCPSGEAYLASNAAAAWDAMRQGSLRDFGIDLYPGGPFSAYRSYAQQLYLYNLYLSGQGSLAAPRGPPPTSTATRSTSPTPRCAPWSTRSGRATAGPRPRRPSEWWHVNYVGP